MQGAVHSWAHSGTCEAVSAGDESNEKVLMDSPESEGGRWFPTQARHLADRLRPKSAVGQGIPGGHECPTATRAFRRPGAHEDHVQHYRMQRLCGDTADAAS